MSGCFFGAFCVCILTVAKAFAALLLSASVANAACALSTQTQPRGEVGLQLFRPDLAQGWADAADLGVTWLRIELRWDGFNRSHGNFDAARTDRVFAFAAANPQMRLMVLINHPPQWTSDEPGRFADHAAAAASWLIRRYGKQVSAVEVFNEPNWPQYGWPSMWRTPKDSAEAYAKTLTAVSSAIRALNHDVLIVSAGLSPTNDPESYLRWMLLKIPPNCVDAIGGHPYGEGGRFFQVQRNAAILLEQEHFPSRPIWFTEYGTPDNAHRSALLASLATDRHAAPVTFFFADQDVGLFSELYGLRTLSGKVKASDYTAFKRLKQGTPK